MTEFLPVSSSGHLVLFGAWLGVEDEGILFEVALHAATLIAVLVFYRTRALGLCVGALRRDADAWRYGMKLVVGTLPAILAVLVARDFFEGLYESVAPLALAFWLSGAMIYSTRWTLPRAQDSEVGWGVALAIGVAQAAAIAPGVSRSGATVSVALALGVAPAAAAEFSFLLSVPAVMGAVVLQIPELGSVSRDGFAAIAAGGAVAMASGLVALWLFVRLLRSATFHRFAWYLWPLGGVVLAWSQLR